MKTITIAFKDPSTDTFNEIPSMFTLTHEQAVDLDLIADILIKKVSNMLDFFQEIKEKGYVIHPFKLKDMTEDIFEVYLNAEDINGLKENFCYIMSKKDFFQTVIKTTGGSHVGWLVYQPEFTFWRKKIIICIKNNIEKCQIEIENFNDIIEKYERESLVFAKFTSKTNEPFKHYPSFKPKK